MCFLKGDSKQLHSQKLFKKYSKHQIYLQASEAIQISIRGVTKKLRGPKFCANILTIIKNGQATIINDLKTENFLVNNLYVHSEQLKVKK